MEEWCAITGYEGRYEVSSLGRVRSMPRKHCLRELILRGRRGRDGYLRVALYDGAGRAKQMFVHRLVCAAFNGAPPADRPDVNHLDGDKQNNRRDNLEWTNDSLNVTHAFRVLGVRRAITRPWLGKFDADHHASKPVLRISALGDIKRYPSVMAAGRDGFSFKHVSAVCRGKRQRHGGYFWRFEDQR